MAQPKIAIDLILSKLAEDAEKDIIEGLKAGADDYISKPFSPDELSVRVERVLFRSVRSVIEDLLSDTAALDTRAGSLDPLIEKLQKAAEYGDKLGATYVELRAESVNRSNTQYDDGRVRSISQRIEEGVAIRILAEGTWGFVTSNDLSPDGLQSSVKDAYSLASRAPYPLCRLAV